MRVHRILFLTTVIALVAAACAPTNDILPTIAPPTQVPPSPEVPTEVPTLAPVTLAGPQSGSHMTWLDGSVLQYIPAGDFVMGSAPQQTVNLDDYWMYKTKVTNSMYGYCVAVGACAPPGQGNILQEYRNPLFANYPMTAVTWDMASNYCAWAGGGLPTEAQWEKAARGVSGAPYPWGNEEPDCSLGNFSGCAGGLTKTTAYPEAASPFGVLDTTGNVFEWVNDYYAETYLSTAPTENPTGPEIGEFRVVRGSSFQSPLSDATVTTRRPAAPAFSSQDLGFRCVIEEPQPLAPMCQLPSYIPSSVAREENCQTPTIDISNDYCENKLPYTRLELSQSSTWTVDTVDTTCTEATVNGIRQLTCTGSDSGIGKVTVCNPACGAVPDFTEAVPVCPTGYSLDASTGNCLYAPAPRQPGLAGCPAGYLLIERGGQNTCAPGPGEDGNCPAGMYLDGEYGACVAVTGGVDVPIGIDQPELAETAFVGCLPGYEYDPSFQCCQPLSGDVYPGCPVGAQYEATLQTCIPSDTRLNAEGCVTLSFQLPQCVEPPQVNLCAKIKTETTCIQNKVNGCQWIEDQGCEYIP